MDIGQFVNYLLNLFSPFKSLNWLDYVIIAVLFFYIIEGYAIGFIASFLDLIGFVLSFIIGLKTYIFAGTLIAQIFSIPPGFSKALGFLITALASEIIIGFLLRGIVYRLLSEKYSVKDSIIKNIDHFLGVIVGMFSALILLSFILTLIISLPVSVFLKHSVSSSKFGNILTAKTQGFEKELNNIFGSAVNDTLSFLTVEPKSDETVNLKFKTENLSVDQNAEAQMLVIVNRERQSQGASVLERDEKLTQVARKHCKDMFVRGYFSHYTPEGLTPFDRIAQGDVHFTYAGENLALAPNTTLAMQGLMKSPGHRANILSANFGKIGIGVIDGGIYGEMFCQEFTD
ncbi:MAG: CvpA family protein [Candidatus Levybacteria bacterium]|nr:CvpA family protein [Candidatus Levybacteria bacterium]